MCCIAIKCVLNCQLLFFYSVVMNQIASFWISFIACCYCNHEATIYYFRRSQIEGDYLHPLDIVSYWILSQQRDWSPLADAITTIHGGSPRIIIMCPGQFFFLHRWSVLACVEGWAVGRDFFCPYEPTHMEISEHGKDQVRLWSVQCPWLCASDLCQAELQTMNADESALDSIMEKARRALDPTM